MTDFKTGHIPDPRDTSFTEDVKKVTEQTIWPEDEMRQRIAELEAENAGLRSHQACTKRAEQAEAERDRFEHLYNAESRVRKEVDRKLAETNKWLHADEPWIQVEEAKAELAALKGRRCETCNEFPHYFICKRDHNPTRWDTFSCSEWTARAEEGGGDE